MVIFCFVAIGVLKNNDFSGSMNLKANGLSFSLFSRCTSFATLTVSDGPASFLEKSLFETFSILLACFAFTLALGNKFSSSLLLSSSYHMS